MRLRPLLNACEPIVDGTMQWTWSIDGTDHGSNFIHPVAADSRLRFCKHTLDGDDAWYNFRYGPFTSIPGVTFSLPFQPVRQFDHLPFATVGVQAFYQVFVSDDEFIFEEDLLVHHQNLWDYDSRVDWDTLSATKPDRLNVSNEVDMPIDGVYKPPTLQPGTRLEHWGTTVPEDCPRCYYQDFGHGYVKPLARGPGKYPYVTDGYLVDARAKGSPAFTWYYQLSFLLVEANKEKVLLSELQLWNPTNLWGTLTAGDQSLFLIPSNEEYFFYYTGRWPVTGSLYPSGTYLHYHAEMFETLLFNATPDAVGLGLPPLQQDKYCLPKLTSETAARTNHNVKKLMRIKCPQCFDDNLICNNTYGKTDCKPWKMREGEVFTSFSLFESEAPFHVNKVQHVTWFIRYVPIQHRPPSLIWNIYSHDIGDSPSLFSLNFMDFMSFYVRSVPPGAAKECGPTVRSRLVPPASELRTMHPAMTNQILACSAGISVVLAFFVGMAFLRSKREVLL